MFALETTAAIFGFLCVLLVVRQNILCWPAGLIQVALYIIVFWKVKLYSDLLLHVVYVFLQIYGWHHWLYGGARRNDLPVSRLSREALTIITFGTVSGSFFWGFLMHSLTDAAAPFADAFILVASLTAQVLMARKKVESWFFWITVDLIALWVYFSRSLYSTTVLYGVFLFLAIAGYLAWEKSLKSLETVTA